jgi:hypothetical protein
VLKLESDEFLKNQPSSIDACNDYEAGKNKMGSNYLSWIRPKPIIGSGKN